MQNPPVAIRRTTAVLLAASLLLSSFADGAAATTDIDGDGLGDLLIGVPLEDHGGRRDAGIVYVVPGVRRDGPVTGRILRQGGGLAERPESNDGFGGAVELVDIDGDGHDDAVIGVPGEGVAGSPRAGVVHVVPGSPAGLLRARATTLVEGRDGLPGAPAPDHAFGWDLASGDFDGDGHGDIAISSVGERAGGAAVAGSVTAIPGSADGLDLAAATVFSQAGSVAGVPAPRDSFGRSLAVGDFDGDGFDDLAIGVPGEDVAGRVDAGAVNVLMGGAEGLTPARNRRFTQVALDDRPEPGDLFGFSLATTDLNCDGLDELVVGVPNEDVSDEPNAGAVHVIAGSRSGPDPRRERFLTAGRRGIPGQLGNAGFGKALAGGDLDGDGCGDLAIGAPFATVGAHPGAGAITIVSGAPSWRGRFDAERLSRANGLPGRRVSGSFIGSAFAVVDRNGDGIDDLAVAAPGDTVGGRSGAGTVTLLLGTRRGLRTTDAVVLDQGSPLPGRPESGDQFGSSLQDGLS